MPSLALPQQANRGFVNSFEIPMSKIIRVTVPEENPPIAIKDAKTDETDIKSYVQLMLDGSALRPKPKIDGLLRHEDVDGVASELLRIAMDPTTPHSWLDTVIPTLGYLTDRDEVLQTLVKLLESAAGDQMVTCRVIRAFENSTHDTKAIISLLSPYRNDPHFRVRWATYYTFLRIGTKKESSRNLIAPLLIEMLDDPWLRVRSDVSGVLGRWQIGAAIPALRERRRDDLGQVRVWAAWAEWKVTGDADRAIALMTTQLYGDTYSGKWEAAYLLNEFETLPPLTKKVLREATRFEIKSPCVGAMYERNRIKRAATTTLRKFAETDG